MLNKFAINIIFYHNSVIVKKIIVFFIILLFTISFQPMAQNSAENNADVLENNAKASGVGGVGNVPVITRRKEAPEALFDMDIGDTDVDFYVTGSWKSELSGGIGIGFSPDRGIIFPAYPYGITSGFRFSQHPDLTLSLWLAERYFFETSLVEGYDLNTILLGYEGKENEFLRHLYIGNANLNIPAYPLMEVPESHPKSPGITASMDSGSFRHDALLRYEPKERITRVYQGMNEVEEYSISPRNFIRGRFFVLPDNKIDSCTVLIESSGGEYTDSAGRTYRTAKAGEYTLSLEEGILRLESEPSGRVLVHYTKNGTPVGDPSLGGNALPAISEGAPDPLSEPIDFSWNTSYNGKPLENRKITIGGKDFLLLWRPGEILPFCLNNVYGLPSDAPAENWRTQVELSGMDTGSGCSTSDTVFDVSEGEVRVFQKPENQRAMENRYPFAGCVPEVYDPSDGYKYAADITINVQFLRSVEAITIGSDAVPGSLTVTVNGERDNRYSADYSKGTVEFVRPVLPDTRIELEYTVYSGSGGNILAVQGNRIQPAEGMELKSAIGLEWNLAPRAFSTPGRKYPGRMVASAEYSAEWKKQRFNAIAGLSLSSSDTTGMLRVFGMEEEARSIELIPENIFPSAVPQQKLGGAGGVEPSRSNRGTLYYVNYRRYDVFGIGHLMPLSWTPESGAEYEYKTGSKPGPYLTAKEEKSGRVLVMDYEIETDKRWVGAQIPFGSNTALKDLSQATSVTCTVKLDDTAEPTGQPEYFLQFGALGEDLDGDGSLDSESSELSKGFTFNDPANSANLLIGTSPQNEENGTTQTEDFDSDSLLDLEESAGVVTYNIEDYIDGGGTLTEGQWKTVTIFLSKDDRARLADSRGVRIAVTRPETDACTGRLLVKDVSVQGAPFGRIAETGTSLELREVHENTDLNGSGIPADVTLQDEFSDTIETLHPESSIQRVLEMSWSGNTGGSPVGGRGVPESIISGYSSADVFFRVGSIQGLSDPKLTYRLISGRYGTAEATVPLDSALADNRWHKLEFTPSKDEVLVDGQPKGTVKITDAEGNPASADTAEKILSDISAIEWVVEGAESGKVYLDEVTLRGSEIRVGGLVRTEYSLSIDKTLLELGPFPVVSGITLNQQAEFMAGEFSTLTGGIKSGKRVTSSTDVSSVIAGLPVSAETDITLYGTEVSVRGGHTIRVPYLSPYASFSDRFYTGYPGAAEQYSRENTASLAIPGIASVTMSAESYTLQDLLRQEWKAETSFLPGRPVSLTVQGSAAENTENFTLNSVWYSEVWLESIKKTVLPRLEAELDSRSSSVSASTKISPPFIQFSAGVSPSYERSYATGWILKPDINVNAEMTLFPEGNGFFPGTVNAVYSRKLLLKQNALGGTDIIEDWRHTQQTLTSVPLFVRMSPYAEFVKPLSDTAFKSQTAGLLYGEYTPKAEISYTRGYGSYLYDLFLPYSVGFSVESTYLRENDSLSQTRSLTGMLRSTAVNLFGNYGAYPFFSWYRSDELTSVLSLTLKAADRWNRPESWELLIRHMATLFQKEENIITLDNAVTVTRGETEQITDKGSIKYTWRYNPKGGVDVPFLKHKSEKTAFFRNTEKALFELKGWTENALFEGVSAGVSHKTVLVLQNLGSIEATLSPRIEVKRLAEGESPSVLIGGEAVIGASFEY